MEILDIVDIVKNHWDFSEGKRSRENIYLQKKKKIKKEKKFVINNI